MGMILIIIDQISLASVPSVWIHKVDAHGYGGVGTQPMRQHQDEWESIDGSATAIR